ncbi:Uncharacterised protein [Vibrio cholerae]|nr:Uncharacterised protein [Vibrio cholerae]
MLAFIVKPFQNGFRLLHPQITLFRFRLSGGIKQSTNKIEVHLMIVTISLFVNFHIQAIALESRGSIPNR